MVKSFGTFTFGIFTRMYWLLPSLASDPFDIAERWLGMNYDAPQWLFWVLLGVGLFVAAFLTYNDVKQKLDEASEEFYFEPTGVSVTEALGTVHINVAFRARPKVIVDKLALVINEVRIPPSEWSPIAVFPQYTDNWTFDLSGKFELYKTYIGKLIATVDRKEHESRDFKVHA